MKKNKGKKMMIKITVKTIFCLVLAVVLAGCDGIVPIRKLQEPVEQISINLYESFGPAEISILPLTGATDDGKTQKISIFVSLLDAFGSCQKWPAVFRFELYERVERSSEPVGRRVKLWPDINLTEPSRNNKYWQDFLRAYKFSLDIDHSDKQNYILQITCILANEKRLTSQFPIKPVIQKNTPP
jgi:hypothetical protein